MLNLGIGDGETNYPPNMLEISMMRFIENDPVGTLLGNVTAVDPDDNYPLSFSLIGNSDLFHITSDGNLSLLQELDYEISPSYSIGIQVSDSLGASTTQYFSLSLQNQIEDLDGDGEEDHYDLDDDGDGFSDEDEIVAGTNPRDANSMLTGHQIR